MLGWLVMATGAIMVASLGIYVKQTRNTPEACFAIGGLVTLYGSLATDIPVVGFDMYNIVPLVIGTFLVVTGHVIMTWAILSRPLDALCDSWTVGACAALVVICLLTLFAKFDNQWSAAGLALAVIAAWTAAVSAKLALNLELPPVVLVSLVLALSLRPVVWMIDAVALSDGPQWLPTAGRAFYAVHAVALSICVLVISTRYRENPRTRRNIMYVPIVPTVMSLLSVVITSVTVIYGNLAQLALIVSISAISVLVLVVRNLSSVFSHTRATRDARRQEKWYRDLVRDTSDAILVCDPSSGVVKYASPVSEVIFGEDPTVNHLTLGDVINVTESQYNDVVNTIDLTNSASLEGRRDGKSLQAVIARRDDRIVVSVRDTSEAVQLRDRLEFLAFRDPLTDLPNRAAVVERIDTLIERGYLAGDTGEIIAVLFIDLDRFKQVNDVAGHPVGDIVLRQVGQRLKRVLHCDTLLGRVGGDEFVVVSSRPESADEIAEVICTTMSSQFHAGGRSYLLGASVGIATGTSEADPEGILRQADLAMYKAKRDRLSWTHYHPSLADDAVRLAESDSTVARAMRTQSMGIFLQPIVSLDTGKVSTVEALLRWTDSDGLVHGPDQMLDFCQRTGQMGSLTRWVLETGIEKITADNSHVTLAVNVAPEVLLSPGLLNDLEELLDEYQLPPERLELEITEDEVLEQATYALDTLNALRDLGVGLSIDDFGTGFSSLGYLVDLPVDALKIDRRFVSTLPTSSAARSIVRGIVAMAHDTGIQVTAEGVQNQEQHRWLSKLGVRNGQGFWYARPEPSDDIDGLNALSAWASAGTLGQPGNQFHEFTCST